MQLNARCKIDLHFLPTGKYNSSQFLSAVSNTLLIVHVKTGIFFTEVHATVKFAPVCTQSVSYLINCLPLQVHNHLAFLTRPWQFVPYGGGSATQVTSTNDTVKSATDLSAHITFIWASHRSGFSHLYLIQRSWNTWFDLVGDVTPSDMHSSGAALILNADEVFTAQLTSGSWEITGKQVGHITYRLFCSLIPGFFRGH